ncbi:uncharacterized protein LOC133332499 [Musca vetustissima]|uniref:uncharacterized protein LOC133332499 n=1 Tax=Musca vetustissima TaxID=27455 RepID=UPI002AB72F7F|nr:uncharacterized protein LOC133332499 [Musca vetustissima]
MTQDFQSKQDYARQLRYARSKFRRINSLDLIPEDPSQEESNDEDEDSVAIQSPTLLSRSNTGINQKLLPQQQQQQQTQRSASNATGPQTIATRFQKILWFWPNLLMNLVLLLLRYLLYIPLSIAAPSFWLSAVLWIFWKIIRIPVEFFKWIFNFDNGTAAQGVSQGAGVPKRTVLISCGSTIQTLHLARNFYSSSGARVVVFEFEGHFGLARFSAAVDKFYTVPKPTPQNIDSYITALCHIVRREKPSVYIPVCATSPAYYDAVAKPHLELLGCATFMTGVQETLILDDCLQFYQRCASQNIAVPPYVALSAAHELWELYEEGFISQFRHILLAVGMQGVLERFKYMLPRQLRDLRFSHEINERQKWLVVRDVPGEHYVTCTTIKSSQVAANVSCRVDSDTKNLIPVTASDTQLIDNWLRTFFGKVRFQRPINCHISFRLIKCQSTGQFLPLGIRLGVSLPYICHNRSHAQILCRTMKCVHMRPLNFNTSPTEEDETSGAASSLAYFGAQWSSDTVALDKREALFAYWDPLPYCAYYHFQLPLESVKSFLQRRRKTTPKAATAAHLSTALH